MRVIDRRLVVVTGKGGVGRSAMSAAIALSAARAGKRTCIVELSGLGSVPPLFGLPGRTYEPRRVTERVDVISITPTDCLDDFGRRKLKVTALLRVVLRSRITRAFVDAVPGLHDLLQLGKIENMISEPMPGDPVYDLVVLDAPATGHGLTMLAAARSMREMTRVGPFNELARIIEEFLSDRRRTAIVLVTLPEALPVSESLELIEALREDKAELAAIVVNQVWPDPLPDTATWPEISAKLEQLKDDDLREVITLAERAATRQRAQREVLAGLPEAVAEANGRPIPVVHVPRLLGNNLDRDALTELSHHLDPALVERT